MTPEEAIKMLRGMQNKKVDYAELVCAPAFAYGYEYVYPEPEDYAIEEAITAIKEIQQYREIGTVEECRKAVEKQKPKQIVIKEWSPTRCPTCNYELSHSVGDGYYKHPTFLKMCPECGQMIRWNKSSGGEWKMSSLKITKCKGEGQGSCKRCDDHGIWNRHWMSMLYKIEGYEWCYCPECVRKIKEYNHNA